MGLRKIKTCYSLMDIFQIQPDMEELTDNAEEIAEEGDSTKDEKKLGRLQFKVYVRKKIFIF